MSVLHQIYERALEIYYQGSGYDEDDDFDRAAYQAAREAACRGLILRGNVSWVAQRLRVLHQTAAQRQQPLQPQ